MSVKLRSYSDADWPAVCDVHDRARRIELSSFVPDSDILPMADVAASDGFFTSETFVATAKATARIAGFVSIDPPELTWLYVDPDFHRQGVARALVAHVLPSLGSDAFVLCARESAPAFAAYQSFGFRIAAIFPGEAHGFPCTCVRLCLPGSRHRDRPPTPTTSALSLAGFTDEAPGAAVRDDGVWRWLAS